MGNGNRKPKNRRPRKEPIVSQPQEVSPQQAAPPRVVRPTQDPGTLATKALGELDDWYLQLRRSYAGFAKLRQALLVAQGQVPEGERVGGLPVFEFPASMPGSGGVVKIAADLGKVNPEHVGHVLIPLMNAQAAELLEAVGEIEERLATVKPLLAVITGVATQPAA